MIAGLYPAGIVGAGRAAISNGASDALFPRNDWRRVWVDVRDSLTLVFDRGVKTMFRRWRALGALMPMMTLLLTSFGGPPAVAAELSATGGEAPLNGRVLAVTELRALLEKRGDLLVHFTSLDPDCGPCIKSNGEFPGAIAQAGWKASFVTVQWSPWKAFPDDLKSLPLAESIIGVPTLVRFHAGHEAARVMGLGTAGAVSSLLAGGAPAASAAAPMAATASAAAAGAASAASAPKAATAAPVATLAVTPATVHALYGTSVALRVEARDAAGAVISAPPGLTYTSSAPGVVAVDATGRATLLRRGKATVRVTVTGTGAVATIDFDVMGFSVLGRTSQDYGCALPDDRLQIYCWGKNLWTIPVNRQGVVPEVPAPVPIKPGTTPTGTRWQTVTSNTFTTCAVSEAGGVSCWGNGREAVLGRGTPRPTSGPTEAAEPAAIHGGDLPANAKLVAVGVGPRVACAAAANGKLYCWGATGTIPLAAAKRTTAWTDSPLETLPGEVPAGAPITDITLSVDGGCVLAGGEVYCWAGNQAGPARVPAGEHPPGDAFHSVETDKFTCGATQANGVYCFGSAAGPRFGAGQSGFLVAKDWRAVSTSAAGGLTAMTLGGIAISSCGLDRAGSAWCWGSGYQGSLGDGNPAKHDAPKPQRVERGEIPSDVALVGISCGEYHCLSLGNDGRIYGWGANTGGILGRASNSLVSSPVPLLGAPPTTF